MPVANAWRLVTSGGREVMEVNQTDAAINPGNSEMWLWKQNVPEYV